MATRIRPTVGPPMTKTTGEVTPVEGLMTLLRLLDSKGGH